MLTHPIILESLSAEAHQFLLQIQTERQLSTLAEVVRQVLEECCIPATSVQQQLPIEQQRILNTVLAELTQCQSQLANTISILYALTKSALPDHATPNQKPEQ